jgi:hypothetical protein
VIFDQGPVGVGRLGEALGWLKVQEFVAEQSLEVRFTGHICVDDPFIKQGLKGINGINNIQAFIVLLNTLVSLVYSDSSLVVFVTP